MNPTNPPDLDHEPHPTPTLDLPPRFYEHLAQALGTTNPTILGAAETSFRGTFPSPHDYILTILAEHLPDSLAWLRDCLDPALTLARYEADVLALWTIPLPTTDHVMVFESRRHGPGLAYTVPYRADRLQVFADPSG